MGKIARKTAGKAAQSKTTRQVVVIGDLVQDNNLVHHEPTATSRNELFSKTVRHQQPGGAWFLKDLIRTACFNIKCEVIAPQEPANTSGQPISQAYSLWTRKKRIPDGKGEVWRVDHFMGCEQASDQDELEPLPLDGDITSPDVLVLDDLSLGFSAHDALWPPLIGDGTAAQIVIKTGDISRENKLFQRLIDGHCDKLTVVLSADVLRRRGAEISTALSWDRTIEETAREFEEGLSASDLGRCRRVVVFFGMAGVATFTRCPLKVGKPANALELPHERVRFERFLYHPDETERIYEARHPGRVFGIGSLLTASVVRHLLVPRTFPLYIALGRALAAARASHEEGAGEGAFSPKKGMERIAEKLTGKGAPDPASTFCTAYPHQVLTRPPLSAQGATASDLLRDLAGPGEEYMAARAMEVVLHGPEQALGEAPKARYGHFLTVDREEIERINAVGSLIEGYRTNPGDRKPLSIAVFGPPGSGKSFAVEQLARELIGEDEPLEFNLSQFDEDDIGQLHQAFHQVRDAAIRGKIPLVFWDEFDAKGLIWLQHFLAPMQDAEFLAGSIAHPFGKAIFVFAGGTSHTFEEFDRSAQNDVDGKNFRSKKGPDFVSRLRGFINIKGPNPTHGDPEEDPSYLIRRAILLRARLELDRGNLIGSDGKAAVSTSVIRGFLRVEKYLHGARSIGAILSMSKLEEARHFGVAELPSEDLLGLHVPAEAFLEQVRKGAIEDEVTEALARMTHREWLKVTQDNKDPLSRPYDRLAEKGKEKNREAARLTLAKLLEVKYDIEPRRPGDDKQALTVFSFAERQELMEIEHDRWVREQMIKGFEWSPGKKKPNLHQHPDVAPFDQIPDKHKEYDGAIIDIIPETLWNYGYKLVKVEPPDEARTELYKGDYFSIHLDDRGTEYVRTGDEVLIVPLTDEGEVIFTREPSAAFGQSTLILPGGETEEGKTRAEQANQELQEEIGYKAGRLDCLGELRPFSKYLTVRSFVFLARDLAQSRLQGDEDYEIEQLRMPLANFDPKSSGLLDARAVAALCLARDFLEKERVRGDRAC